ncbi:MAG: DUF559 domain-containing protein [Thaumarchaeota archaeon]|nr:DUF559 domain-containing protein [Nitrososphaerota archaeon]
MKMGTKKKEWKSFDEARDFTRSLKLKDSPRWLEYCKYGKDGKPKPLDIPAAPEHVYKNKGWKGWIDWLGNENRKMPEMSEKTKDKLSTARANQKLPVKYTKPEIIPQEICKDAEIEFITHKPFKLNNYELHNTRMHNVDIFIEPNICLFADGDYWHANPNPYRVSRTRLHAEIKPDEVLVTSSKKKKIAKVIRERDDGITRDLESQGYTVLRFWESELLFDKEKCRQKIIDVVNKSKAII